MNLFQDIITRGLSRVKVVHRLPGRVRIHIPILSHASPRWVNQLHLLEKILSVPRGVNQVDIEPRTGNILIVYDPSILNEQDILNGVKAILSWVMRYREEIAALLPEDAESVIERLKASCHDGAAAELLQKLKGDLPNAFWS